MASGRSIAIWMLAELEEELMVRGDNRSGTISRDLGRLYGLYRRALWRIHLTPAEAVVICHVIQGTTCDAQTAPSLWAAVEDTCQLEGVSEQYGVDCKVLVEKLRRLDDAAALAVVDAAERALRLDEPLQEAVVKVGLAKSDTGTRQE